MRALFRGLAALLLIGGFQADVVAQGLSPYEGEAPVADQSEGERRMALPHALAQVLVKLTGDAGAATDPAYAELLAASADLVQQYRYREDVATAGGIPVVRLHLIGAFDRAALEAAVARAGGTLWPDPRPRPLLWLAIDDGRGPRLLGESQSSAVSALVRRAAERGLEVSIPLADTQDQTLGGAQAVWREDIEAIASAATRYGSDPVLIGKLQRGSALWSVQWILLDRGNEIGRWRAVNAQAGPLLSSGADSAADALAQRYAQSLSSVEPQEHEIEVSGLGSAAAYAQLLGYLRSLSVVRAAVPLRAQGDLLRVRLSLSTDASGFAQQMHGAGPLLPDAEAEPDARRYRWEP